MVLFGGIRTGPFFGLLRARPPAGARRVRILYVASDQVVPGRTGGSVHVLEVARGLAARGHEVHAVVHATDGAPGREETDGVHWHRVRWWPPHRLLPLPGARARWRRWPDALRPQVVMERYYNFGGEGVADRRGARPCRRCWR